MTNSLSWALAYAYGAQTGQIGVSLMPEGASRHPWFLGISCL